ncbi:TetR/AcrR family transcriptional regulator [Auraticoccus monumenti]|uniref:DNA-binding transcriptional regulator, AcrR family n=1 Tax=Auraticoccus monumenti TaxID=675864 RepID=A0A1G7BJR7_9ACTN|nr:TetR/AcrR family transcriptional regulator [Auraticoccus monumenti]SDE27334.1 DNA-binding transcriptional regulator, AcrR family [Auraticoccus monumenti]
MATRTARPPARERLLTAAEELFYEHGISATGVDAVLRRAEVSPATLYAHFAGKDHLVAAYLQRRLDRWRTTWDEVLQRCGDDPVARALSLFDALAEFERTTTRGCAFLAAAVEVTDPQHPAHPVLVADTRLLQERLGELAAGTGARDPDALAAELLLLYDGALAARTRRATTSGPDEATGPAVRELAAAAIARHTAAAESDQGTARRGQPG